MQERAPLGSPTLVEIKTKVPPAQVVDRLQTGTDSTLTVDVNRLENDLRARVRGEVRFSSGDRGLYASDAGNYRMIPIGVVLPRDAEDVAQTVATCRAHGAPIVARGGGTGIPGQTVNVAVVLDFSKYMNAILELDPRQKTARVQPGLVLDALRDAAEQHGLTFGPDPATHSRCTLGGMIGNNSCGAHSVMAGETVDNIDELEVLTYDGTRMWVGETSDDDLERIVRAGGRRSEIYARLKSFQQRYADAIRRNFPRIPRRVSGYNLPALLPENGFHVARALVGSEATCVLILQAKARLVDSPPARSLLALGYPDIFTAADHVLEPMEFHPIAVESMDNTILADMQKKRLHPPGIKLLPKGNAWLLVEFGGPNKQEADAGARKLMAALSARPNPPDMKLFDDSKQEKLVWEAREEALGATAKVPDAPENHEGWEDSSVPPEKLGAYLRDFKKLIDGYGYEGPLYGHFGQGCVHTRLTFDLETADGIAKWRRFLAEAADLVVSYGGSLSGEHGDGQARAELLPHMFDAEMIQAFREFKSIWDPEWKMNPGKLIAPYRVDENLRLGTRYHPPEPRTHFEYPDDRHSFAYATERCVGAGVCRRHHGGTMCPSYMATREEKHSTRGRAHLLNEMLRGEVIRDGWKSREVFEALDLCLSCKGCKGECPVQVDIATYKAEFLAHYYQGRIRPRTAFTMGRIHFWARLAAWAPQAANLLAHLPGLAQAAKLAAGVHPNRTLPRFAPYTFKEWFRRRRRQQQNGSGTATAARPGVILWADTFNNHFHPRTAEAAVEVLEAAGFAVQVPRKNLCCGRPLYDWGMLDQAKALLAEILETLQPAIQEGLPIVVLEPSCASVFRDELRSFFPASEDARRLSAQTFLLSEFLARKAPPQALPKLQKQALLHGHCHHKSLFHMDDEERVLEQMGVTFQMPESGCCGMAGAFGFETDHYDVARKCGERVLLPEVRQMPKNALIISDGFSCREQIRQGTGRQALHLADVIRMAIEEGPNGRAGDYPETRYVQQNSMTTWPRTIARVAGAVAAAWLLWRAGQHRRRCR